MNEKIHAIARKVKKLALFPAYLKLKINNEFKVLPEENKKILFALEDNQLYLDNDGNGRFPFLLSNAFSEAGYSVYFLNNGNFLSFVRLEKYGRGIYSIKNAKVVSRLPVKTKDIIYVFDAVRDTFIKKEWKRLVYVNLLKPPFCKVGELITIPFFMHPILYYLGLHESISSIRWNERKIRVFFAGNTAKGSYNKPSLRLQGQLTRVEALQTISENCALAKFSNNIEEIQSLLNGSIYLNECRILETDRNHRIIISDWLNMLSRCDFFLCLSGVEYPMCHNAIEAMAVGSIPIVGYFDWFDPPLEHGKNAIIFSGQEDLAKKVNEIFRMRDREIKTMRHNVISYYEEHLSPKSFVRKFESSAAHINTLMLFPKLACSKKSNDQGKIVYGEIQSAFKCHLLAENNH